jgi:uncharacterized protein YndB with AHSA1/START domain
MGSREGGHHVDDMTTAPVRASVTVRAPRDHAFRVFSERMADWWPVSTHSIEPDRIMAAAMECRPGGRIVERHADGRELSWGVVRVWEPPARIVFSWNPTYEQRPETEVEVTFTELAHGATRVDLEHRGWEALGARAASLKEGYDEGWPLVLGRYAQAAPVGVDATA